MYPPPLFFSLRIHILNLLYIWFISIIHKNELFLLQYVPTKETIIW